MANKAITFGADLLPNSTTSSYSLGNSTKKWQINGVADPKLTDTTYSTGTTSSSGLTKLYASTGTATDGTMTQAAIKSALDGKANSSHGNHVPAKETADHARYLRNDNTWQTVTPEKIGAAVSDHIHYFAGSDSVGGSAKSAVKLNTARTIGIGTGAIGTATSFDGSANITIPVTEVKESYLSWGGKNIKGDISPIGMACSSEHNANRLAFINGNALTFEYSSNGGSTWTDYDYSAADKSSFCTQYLTVPIGRASTSTAYTTNSKSRVTIAAQSYVYTNPKKMLINISSSGSMNVLIEYKTGESNASWKTFETYRLSGWSGWNDIPLILGTLGGTSNQTSNIWFLRLTFSMTSVNSSYNTTAQVNAIRLFGTNNWGEASSLNGKGSMSGTGHLYSYDINANATFPANVTAASFTGALYGNANTATKLTTSAGSGTQPIYFSDGKPVATTYALNKTVPSDAKFTDTTYSAGTGMSLSGTTFSNAGVRSIATGGTNGTISVNTNGTTANVAVKGLGSAAYTDSSAYATYGHTHNYAGSSSAGGSATSALNSNKINGYELVISSSAPPANGTYTNTIYIQYE